MTKRLLSLMFFCFKFSDWIISFVHAQAEFSLNIVYVYNEAGECNGSLPTVRLSTRLGSLNATVPVKNYSRWAPVSGNCHAAQNLTLSLPSISDEILSTSIADPHYQFRIELSPANPCHCLNVDSATGVTGNNIFSGWRDGRLWCGNNITLLCASNSDNVTYYSALIRSNGLLSMVVPLCDNSTDESLGNSNVSVMQSCSSTPALCAAENGVWNETLKCSVTRAVDNCSLANANATRVCHCNGEWGQVHCHPSLQLVEELLQASLAEESLIVLSQLLPNATNITQRLDILVRAVREQVNSTLGVTETFIQLVLNIVEDTPIEVDVPDSSFLSILDMVALNLKLNKTVISQAGTIWARVRKVLPGSGSGHVLGIQVGNNNITLPGEIFEDITESAFVASFHYENISHLLPEEAQEPISPVMSSTLDCTGCKTSNLSENVTVFFDLPPRTTNNRTKCVFADLEKGVGPDFWNESGCKTIDFGNGSVMCSCNHLTHFAILLSSEVDPDNGQIQKIVIVLVLGSIALVFLLATILAFVLQKSLWDMRNYIHCMLCGSMFTAVLSVMVGVEATENEALCIAIAVLLHYVVMVMFMWTLMEGVVLYVVLVQVFITHHKRYIALFTIASFGVPLLYMLVVAPLGFLVNTETNYYGYVDTSGQIPICWLRYEFIWAHVVPIILIILVNAGFLIMVLVIIYRHLKKEEKSKRDAAKHWLKVIISLVIVMGIAWIGKIIALNFNNEAFSFITNIFVVCQGVVIFILFVLLSKQVRDAYIKWWRKTWLHSRLTSREHLPAKNTSPMNSKELLNKV